MRYAGRLASLGPSLSSRLRIFGATLYLVARNRAGLRPARWIPLRFATQGGSFSAVVDDISDLHAVDEILLREQYDRPIGGVPRTIVDLGSHIGISVAYFRLRYPEAQIFAFEPNPESFRKLQRVVAGMDRVFVRNVALSSRSGQATLYVADRPLRASLKDPRESGRTVTVEAISLDSAIRELSIGRIDLLKMDIEGAELDVLSSSEHLDSIETIVGELHPELLGEPIQEFFAVLSEYEIETCPAGDDLVFFARRR